MSDFSLRCLVGLHRWKYFWKRGHRRHCIRCKKAQSSYRSGISRVFRWIND